MSLWTVTFKLTIREQLIRTHQIHFILSALLSLVCFPRAHKRTGLRTDDVIRSIRIQYQRATETFRAFSKWRWALTESFCSLSGETAAAHRATALRATGSAESPLL